MAEVVLNNMGFNYPLLLCTFHTACNWAGTALCHRVLAHEGALFERQQWNLVILLSVISSLNTAIGKASVAVPTTFDQILRAAVPWFVVVIASRVFKRSISRARKMAVAPIVLGMVLAWFGEMQVSMATAWASLACVVLSAAKTVIWSEMLTGDLRVTPIQLLARLAPMVLIQVGMFAVFRGEASAMLAQWRELMGGYALWVVAFTGMASFIISLCTMQATKFATPLTVSVLGCLKQLLVIGFSIFRLSRPLSRLNLIGILMVTAGLVRYTIVSFSERKTRRKLHQPVGGAKERATLLPIVDLGAGASAVGKKKHHRGKVGKGDGTRAPFWGWLGAGKRNASALHTR